MSTLVTAILARLLTPSDFGLIAMVAVFSSFVGIFANLGLTSAIIQKKEVSDETLSSTFWINVGVGALMTIALAASAPLLAAFYSEPQLIPLVALLSTIFFIASFGSVQTALLTKRMNFKALAVIYICAYGISGSISVFLAFSGYGVWSLAWNQVLAAFFIVVFASIYARWVPHFSFGLQHVKGVLGFGANVTAFNFVNYFGRNADNLLIGRFLGATPLGFYNLAYNLLLFPLNNISAVIGSVMFPALSIIQHDKHMVREAYVAANRYVAVVSFPLMTWLIVAAPQVIIVVFGPKWASAIVLVQILALTGLMQSIQTNTTLIFLSQGRTDIMLRWATVCTIIVLISFAIGLRWGVEGVALAYTIANFSIFYPSLAISFRLIDLKMRYFFAQLRSVILATLTLGIFAYLTSMSLEKVGVTQDLAILAIVTLASLLSYVACIFILDRELFNESLRLLGHLRSTNGE